MRMGNAQSTFRCSFLAFDRAALECVRCPRAGKPRSRHLLRYVKIRNCRIRAARRYSPNAACAGKRHNNTKP